MSRIKCSSVLVATAALVAGMAAGVAAQERRDSVADRGGMGMMRMMAMMEECPMMRSARPGPAAALEHREALGLADAQVERLKRLEGEASKAQDEAIRATRDVLTPEQREKLASLSGGMKGDHAMMMRMMDHMASTQCPMMRDDSAGAHHMRRP